MAWSWPYSCLLPSKLNHPWAWHILALSQTICFYSGLLSAVSVPLDFQQLRFASPSSSGAAHLLGNVFTPFLLSSSILLKQVSYTPLLWHTRQQIHPSVYFLCVRAFIYHHIKMGAFAGLWPDWVNSEKWIPAPEQNRGQGTERPLEEDPDLRCSPASLTGQLCSSSQSLNSSKAR